MHQLYQILFALAFNVLDLITGITYAAKEKKLTSSKLRDGLFKKVGFIFCYLLGFLIDSYGYLIGFNLGVKVLVGILLYSVLTEIVSIAENLCKISPQLKASKILSLLHVNNSNEKE